MLKGTDFSWIRTGSEYDEANAAAQARYINACSEYSYGGNYEYSYGGNYDVVFVSKEEGYYVFNQEDLVAVIRYENHKEWRILSSDPLTVSDLRIINRVIDAIDSMGGLRKEWIFPK